MNKYELALVVNSNLDDDAKNAVLDKVKALIEKFGGTVSDVDDQGKKRLAYEIQKMIEANYYFIHFDADAECPAKLEANVRIMEPVLRYLIVKAEA
ncbi:MAG: 30S ribosomal protein S6 [Lachnospiraceae bacterium]|nr:30S ribosomal protein S6 [Lachnospiraceae bacterium]